jgi:hypothetical protein
MARLHSLQVTHLSGLAESCSRCDLGQKDRSFAEQAPRLRSQGHSLAAFAHKLD